MIANRLWKMAFGVAVIEPLDEMSDNNAPVNPELMRRLEALVKESGYDMKTCLRVIFNTRAYQAASAKQEVLPGTPYHFTGPILRRMRRGADRGDSFVAHAYQRGTERAEARRWRDNTRARITKGGETHRRARSTDAGGDASRRQGRG